MAAQEGAGLKLASKVSRPTRGGRFLETRLQRASRSRDRVDQSETPS